MRNFWLVVTIMGLGMGSSVSASGKVHCKNYTTKEECAQGGLACNWESDANDSGRCVSGD